VAVSIKRWNTEPEHQGWVTIKPEYLHAEYTTWIKQQHESFDVGAVFNEGGLVIVTQARNKKELNITKDGEIATTHMKKRKYRCSSTCKRNTMLTYRFLI